MPMTKPGTAPATSRRPLSDVARHVVAPEGIASTEWPSVAQTCNRLGWGFDRWQFDAGRLILAKRADGTYAADTTCISIPRQVGKTYLIACIIFALCLLKPGLTVIWTAHRKTTARETFDQFDGMAQRPKVAPHIRQVLHGKGDEAIHFANGSRILFGARESGFGRGFAGVDVLVCDEGQILPESTLEDLGATQNTAPNPLFFVMGTPPRPRDPGEFFTLLRQEALDGESDSTLYIETSADRGTDPMDPEQLRKANPSYPHRTTHRALLRLRKKLKNDDAWNREARGIWDEITKQFSPFNGALWGEAVDVGPPSGTKPNGFAVDMSHGREISVEACWVEKDSAHVEEVWAGMDEAAAVKWVADAWRRSGRGTVVFIDGQSPAASMIPTLKALGVKVLTGNASDMSRACGLVKSNLEAGRLTHADQESVNAAREGSRKRAIGTAGGWGLDRSDPSVNIAPMVGLVLARLAASMSKKPASTYAF
ncbi:terminase large subunit domain-containing protein [Nocardioides sp. URHA0032]|uniref:terminase large subunit domain-containing protein n=1 Tax=Nocardioides sp. URHA0032 TaxID=1380388 RepID=UPI00048A84B4|nr:terminase family protein [Nocardioides sp. URHA0032]